MGLGTRHSVDSGQIQPIPGLDVIPIQTDKTAKKQAGGRQCKNAALQVRQTLERHTQFKKADYHKNTDQAGGYYAQAASGAERLHIIARLVCSI